MRILTRTAQHHDQLKHFRRRTWTVVAACLLLRITAGTLDVHAASATQPDHGAATCSAIPQHSH
jgi:hypothetical protein